MYLDTTIVTSIRVCSCWRLLAYKLGSIGDGLKYLFTGKVWPSLQYFINRPICC